MFFSRIIGTGSYGHVFYPCLPYLDISDTNIDIQTLNNMNNKYKVSKLIETYYAKKEMSRYEIIRMVDPSCEFHLGTMFLASPSRQNIPLISQCADGKHIVSNFQDYQFIVMKYGGTTLRDFGSTIYNDAKRFIKNENTPTVLAFWKDTLRLIHGIECMIQYNIIHNDIKTSNIVYDIQEKRLNFIDFGMVQHMKNVYKKSLQNDYEYDIFYYSMPPETYFYNQKRFDIWRKLSYNERECWFQYACTSWNVGNHEKTWDSFFETYFLPDKNSVKPYSSGLHASQSRPSEYALPHACDQTLPRCAETKSPSELVVEGYASQKPSDQISQQASLAPDLVIERLLALNGYDLLPNPCDNDFEDYSKSYMDILQEIKKEMKHMDSFAKHVSDSDIGLDRDDVPTRDVTRRVGGDASSSCTRTPTSSLHMIPEKPSAIASGFPAIGEVCREHRECEDSSHFIEQSVENFRSFLLKDIDNYQDFKEFMQHSLYSIDIYGLGQSLMYMLIETHHNLPIRFIKKIYKLLQKMMNHNLTERIAMKDLIEEYKHILQEIIIS